MRTVLLIAIVTATAADSRFGVWNMNAARSTFTGGGQPRSLRVQIEPHLKGEVFTMDRREGDGSARSSSSILYFDGAPRDIQDFDCAGTQSSSRLDDRTIEIRRKCAGSDGTWLIRQSMKASKELLIDITEDRRGAGPNREWHVVLQRQ
jgi:hypothetical protein